MRFFLSGLEWALCPLLSLTLGVAMNFMYKGTIVLLSLPFLTAYPLYVKLVHLFEIRWADLLTGYMPINYTT